MAYIREYKIIYLSVDAYLDSFQLGAGNKSSSGKFYFPVYTFPDLTTQANDTPKREAWNAGWGCSHPEPSFSSPLCYPEPPILASSYTFSCFTRGLVKSLGCCVPGEILSMQINTTLLQPLSQSTWHTDLYAASFPSEYSFIFFPSATITTYKTLQRHLIDSMSVQTV